MSKETLTAIAKSAILSEIYKDVAKPSARRIGASLESLTKITVSPISIIDWGFEKSSDWLRQKIELRFARTPSEEVRSISGCAMITIRRSDRKALWPMGLVRTLDRTAVSLPLKCAAVKRR